MKAKILMMLLAGLVLLGACKSSGSSNAADTAYQVINNRDKAIAGSTDTAAANIAKLVKSGQMRLKVKNVQQSSEVISALTGKFNGMVMHHSMSSNMEGTRSVQAAGDSVQTISVFNTIADLTLKLPSDKLEDFMNLVNHMSIYVNERKMDIEDHTFDYMATQLRTQARRQIVSQQQSGKIVIKNPANVLLLKDDIIDGQVETRRIDDAVKYSIINLSLYQSHTLVRETVVNDDLNAYNLPFAKRMVLALGNGLDMFMEFIIALTNLWLFVLVAIAALLAYTWYKRRHPAAKPTAG